MHINYIHIQNSAFHSQKHAKTERIQNLGPEKWFRFRVFLMENCSTVKSCCTFTERTQKWEEFFCYLISRSCHSNRYIENDRKKRRWWTRINPRNEWNTNVYKYSWNPWKRGYVEIRLAGYHTVRLAHPPLKLHFISRYSMFKTLFTESWEHWQNQPAILPVYG